VIGERLDTFFGVVFDAVDNAAHGVCFHQVSIVGPQQREQLVWCRTGAEPAVI